MELLYEERISHDVEKYHECNDELHKEYQNEIDILCESFGIINVYSQIFILDTDIRKTGIKYERI